MERKYNFIYSKLVENEADFVGQIAYSLYKQDKINHIKEFQDAHQTEITAIELDPFVKYPLKRS